MSFGPLERVKPAEPVKPDPAPYRPIPGRPRWLMNGKGQMARQGATPVPPAYPWYGLPIIPTATPCQPPPATGKQP